MIYLGTHKFVDKTCLPALSRYKQQYTVVSTFEDRHEIPAYRELNGMFGFPLYHKYPVPELAGMPIIDQRALGSAVSFNMITAPRSEQSVMLDRFDGEIASGKTGIILDARTGLGKTFLGAACIAKLGRTAIVVVPKTDLLYQWVHELLKHTDLKDSDIGVVQRDEFSVVGKKVVIGMLHTLLRRKYSSQFYRSFGTLLVDELQTLGCPHFSKLINLFPTKYKLGTTATVERRDGTTDIFLQAIGECIVRSKARREKSLQVVVRAIRYSEKGKSVPYIPKWAVTMMQQRSFLLTHWGMDARRCMLLAYYTQKLAKEGRQVAVLAERIEQLRNISYFLRTKYEVPDSWIGDYIGKIKKIELKRAIKECRILLATTKMLAMGTDIPSLSCLILASPLASIKQPIGRILRKRKGKSNVIVIDLVDDKFYMARSWFTQRQKEYAELRAEIQIRGSN